MISEAKRKNEGKISVILMNFGKGYLYTSVVFICFSGQGFLSVVSAGGIKVPGRIYYTSIFVTLAQLPRTFDNTSFVTNRRFALMGGMYTNAPSPILFPSLIKSLLSSLQSVFTSLLFSSLSLRSAYTTPLFPFRFLFSLSISISLFLSPLFVFLHHVDFFSTSPCSHFLLVFFSFMYLFTDILLTKVISPHPDIHVLPIPASIYIFV